MSSAEKLDSASNSGITYAKIVSIPSSTSACASASTENSDKYSDKMHKGIGSICRSALPNAKREDRLIVGLTQSIKTLSNDPDDTMFCILAQPKPGDSAAHMQVILLEAFCYENGIYTIKVDDMEKLSNLIGATNYESCCLIQRYKHKQSSLKLKIFDLEEHLVDHCEDYWDAQHKPIIRLPDE